MQLSFLGAAGTVTGSKYLLSFGSKKILIDCGLFQGHKELRELNWDKLPVNPYDIDAVILTHAHIDHSGYLPLLVKRGFVGPIYCTQGTKELCSILLPNSGALQEEEADYRNRHGTSKHKPALPLYTKEDAEKILPKLIVKNFDKVYDLFDDVQLSFKRAGHIIGSACVRITHQGQSILFTGDLGRPNDELMRAPEFVDQADYLVVESTYGNHLHDPQSPQTQLAAVINKTIKRHGTVVIPAFAVGRAQSILYYISQLKSKKLIPDVPVFLDSPMAVDATEILCHHIDELNINKQVCELSCRVAKMVNTPAQSKKLNEDRVPSIIISASGMASGGRVLHHLKFFAPDPKNTVLFTGFQAGGTRGARMVRGEKEVRIYGENVAINAQVEVMSNLSAHADYQEILDWLGHIKKAPKKVFITHGEGASRVSLKEKIEARFGWACVLPEYLQVECL